MSKLARVVAVLLFAIAIHADDRSLFLLRTYGWDQGILSFDPVTGSEMRLADFVFQAALGSAEGGLQLTAFHDRIVAQGTGFYEFDIASGQFLRRYPALAPGYDTWAFQGVAVDRDDAALLGLEPGFYGSVVCTDEDGMGGLCGSTPEPFPGYETWKTNLSEQRVFFRRGLEPGDRTLEVVQMFDRDAAGNPFGRRFTALDRKARRFRFWLQGNSDTAHVRRLTSAAISGGAISPELIEHETLLSLGGAESQYYESLSLAFDPLREELFRLDFYTQIREMRIVRLRNGGEEEVVSSDPAGPRYIHSITARPETPPATYTQLLPAVADTPGANGTYWQSDVWLFNPSDSAVSVEIERVSKPAGSLTLTLGAHASQQLTNILGQMGGGVASDALIIRSSYRDGNQLSVLSRTFTPAPEGGSYGQAIPTVPSTVGYSTHVAMTSHVASIAQSDVRIILDKRNLDQYRHNLGVVNTSDEPLTMKLRYLARSTHYPHDPVRDFILSVPPHAQRQYAMEGFFPRSILENEPPVINVYGDQPAAIYLSIVDNKSGDASFIPFALYGIESGPGSTLAIPGITHSLGANDTFWRTDAYGVFSFLSTGGQAQVPFVNYHSGVPCRVGDRTQTLEPTPGWPKSEFWHKGWFSVYSDIAAQLCPGIESSGALEVRTGSWMTMVSRTYTTREDGGTYGEILPLYPPRGWPSRHFGGIRINGSVRVNVGLYNGSDARSQVGVRLYSASGELVVERIVTLEPRQTTQQPIQQLLDRALPEGLYGISFVTIEGPGCWPYISTVDNVTGDSTNWW